MFTLGKIELPHVPKILNRKTPHSRKFSLKIDSKFFNDRFSPVQADQLLEISRNPSAQLVRVFVIGDGFLYVALTVAVAGFLLCDLDAGVKMPESPEMKRRRVARGARRFKTAAPSLDSRSLVG